MVTFRLGAYGDLSLGDTTSDYDAMTQRRVTIHRKFMQAALDRPEEFSPVGVV